MIAKFKNIFRLFIFNLPKEFSIDSDYRLYSVLLFFAFIILGNVIKLFDPNYSTTNNFFLLIASVGIILKYLFHNLIFFLLFYYLCKFFSLLLNSQNIKLLFTLSIGFNSFIFFLGVIISVFISILSTVSINNFILLGITIDGTINFNDNSVKIISILSLLSSVFVGYSAKFIKPISFSKVILTFFVSTVLSNTLFALIGYSLRGMIKNMI